MANNKRNIPIDPDVMYEKCFAEALKMVDTNLSVNHYDYTNSATKRRMENDLYERSCETLKITRKALAKFAPNDKCGISKRCIKKRCSASVEYANEIHERYASRYPQLCVEDVFFDINYLCANYTYDMLSGSFYFTYAISLWILDELLQRGKIGDAIRYLPNYVYEDDVDMPDFEDSCHNRELIARMMYVIENRDSENIGKHDDGIFVNEATLSFKGKRTYRLVPFYDEISDRERFDSIISMIPQAIINRAISRFEQKEWEFVEICLGIVNDYRTEEVRLLTEMKSNLLHQREEKKTFDNKADILNYKNNKVLTSPLFPLSNSNFVNNITEEKVVAEAADVIKGSLSMSRSLVDDFEKCRKLDECKRSVSYLSYSDNILDMMCEDGTLNKKQADKLKAFNLQNPYETLFAFLYLLDSGSSLPWLYNQTQVVLNTAKNQLPWAFAHITKRDWENEPDDYEEDDELEEDECESEEMLDELPDEPLDWIDEESKLYQRDYTDACLWCEPDEADPNKFIKMNLAQILFENSDIVMPRNVSFDFDTAPLLEKSGFAEAESKAFERYCTLARSCEYKEIEERLMRKMEIDADSEDKEEIFEQPDEENIQQEDISSYKKEIERLKNELKALHQNRNEFRKKSEDLSTENEELKAEISELREFIHPTDNKNNEQCSKEKIDYPYSLEHRFVVYGGHPSWLRAIKPLLTNIRFIDDTVVPNANLIKNADAIWIQSNAIGHSFYYKILDVTRTHDVPLEYFSFASAEKCAEQIIEYDRKMK